MGSGGGTSSSAGGVVGGWSTVLRVVGAMLSFDLTVLVGCAHERLVRDKLLGHLRV